MLVISDLARVENESGLASKLLNSQYTLGVGEMLRNRHTISMVHGFYDILASLLVYEDDFEEDDVESEREMRFDAKRASPNLT